MGDHGLCPQPNGPVPNGIFPSKMGRVTCTLNMERWLKAEELTSQLIARIQPNEPSEQHRKAVTSYVQRLVKQCCSCEVLPFGSVPLKTYLPDGDIDLTTYSEDENLKNSLADKVCEILENEEKNENAEFHVKEVQFIQAEVKLIKCLVEDIVVDISFNQLGGLSTLYFLEEIDLLINHDHLFKRSIILIKAWCYYESRILGAHHGLISTYALEILVLYIFNVFNNSFGGPLEVLYRFLEFFSNFDWDNFCVSLWGPVPISSFPDMAPKPARVDNGNLLLNKVYLDMCSTKYAVPSGIQSNKSQSFVPKHFNIVDPLRISNNLGRSVSKGNFFRIRSAFAFGAKRLARLHECPKEDLLVELNQFFTNTRVRHGSGVRPDASSPTMPCLVPVEEIKDTLSTKGKHDDTLLPSSHGPQNGNLPFDKTSSEDPRNTNKQNQNIHRNSTASDISRARSQRNYMNSTNSKIPNALDSDMCSRIYPRNDKTHKYVRRDHSTCRQGSEDRFQKKSSSDLADVFPEVLPEGDYKRISSKKTNQTSSQQGLKADDIISSSQSLGCTDPIHTGEELVPVSQMLDVQHERDKNVDNVVAASNVDVSDEKIQFPINLDYPQFPVGLPPVMLSSTGYYQRNIAGVIPTGLPLIRPMWTSNIQFYQGLVPTPSTPYHPSSGSNSNPGDTMGLCYENSGTGEVNLEQSNDFRHEQDHKSFRECASDNGFLYSGDVQQHLAGLNLISPKQANSSSMRRHHNDSSENKKSEYADKFAYEENGEGDACSSSDRNSDITDMHVAEASASSRKTISEGLVTGSEKSSRPLKDKRRRKVAASAVLTYLYGKSKSDWLHESSSDQYSEEADDEASPHARSHESDVDDPTQVNGPDSMAPIAPAIVTEPQNTMVDNSRVIPFAFYPSGQLPFLAMFPVYGLPSVRSSSQGLTRQYDANKGSEHLLSNQNSDSEEGSNQHDVLTRPVALRSDDTEFDMEHKPDILNSDFVSHWENLQFGRLCQNLCYYAPIVNPSSVSRQPAYSQGHFLWNRPDRPHSADLNMYQQIPEPRLVPVASLRPAPKKDSDVYQSSANNVPRYHGTTGACLPNHKVPFRDGHSLNRKEHRRSSNYTPTGNADRQGNWIDLKPRYGTAHSCTQTDKSISRPAQIAKNGSRVDRPWEPDMVQPMPLYQGFRRPFVPEISQDAADMESGLYTHPSVSSNRSVTTGSVQPSVMMLYRHDQGVRYDSHAESLECGSLGPVDRHGNNYNVRPSNMNPVRGASEQRHTAYKANPSCFSAVQLSLPQHQRRMTQRDYQLKDQDFPPL